MNIRGSLLRAAVAGAVGILIILTISQISIISCSKSIEPEDITRGQQVSSSGCLEFVSADKSSFAPPCCSCFEYEYDGLSTLNLSHIGACFNCCSDIGGEVSVDGNVIAIEENESGEMCHCLCLYQVDYKVENLPPGEYTIKFIELCMSDEDEALELTVNLGTDPTGHKCIERNHYPWDEN